MQIVQFPAPPPPQPTVWFEDVVPPLLGLAMGMFVLWQGFRLLHTHLDRRTGGAPGRVETVRTELEERLDFMERVLAKQGRDPLPRGEP